MSEQESWVDSEGISEKEKATLFIEEAKLIQNVINRMATNAFLVKGWAITLIVGVFVLKPEGHRFLIASLLPAIGFWWLDAFFLHQEKLFRELYNHQIIRRRTSFDNLFSLDTTPFRHVVPDICKVMFSPTLRTFYLIIIVLILICFWMTTPQNSVIPKCNYEKYICYIHFHVL